MTRSPLQLENYLFTEISVKANPAYRVSSEEAHIPEVKATVRVLQNKDASDKWLIFLDITIFGSAKNGPYDISLGMMGDFLVKEESQGIPVEKIVAVWGPTLLYSAAREYILATTGRMPWGALIIPTTSFIDGNLQIPESDTVQ